MSIDSIPSAWRTNLETGGQTDRDERLYIDFRGIDYPDLRGASTYIDRGGCESTTPPALRGETSDTHSNATFARSSSQYLQGAYSYLHTKTNAAGTEAYTAHQDSTATNDMHGFVAGESVEVTEWVYVPSSGGPLASEVTLRVQEYYSASWNATTIDTASTQDAWEKLSGRITLNASTVAVRVESVFASTVAQNEYYYVDNLDAFRYPTFTKTREHNLIDRANCESTTPPALIGETSVTSANVTFARSSEQKRSGDYSYKITKTNAAGAGNGYAFLSDNINSTDLHGMVPGQAIEVTARVRVPSSGGPQLSEVWLQVQYYDVALAGWQTISGSSTDGATPSAQDDWVEVSASGTLSAEAGGFRVGFYIGSDATLNEYYYVDDIIVRRHSVPGSHYLSGGYTEHLCQLAETGTIQVDFLPQFAYSTASAQYLFSWYISSTQRLRCYYTPSTDQFVIAWVDGGSERFLFSAQYDDGTSYRNIGQRIRLTLAYDFTTGTTSGTSLWLNGTQDDTAWNSASDVISSTFGVMQVRAYAGTVGDFDIAYIRYFKDYVATNADVQNDFKDVENEEIYWPFDGHANGETRCHIVSEPLVQGISFEKGVANRLSGAHSSNIFSAVLLNLNGEFSDDQNAAFDPANRVYNGTSAQNYLQRQNRVRVEDWYSGGFDNVFVGRLSRAGYVRDSVNENISVVKIGAFDSVRRMSNFRAERGRHWEDANISSTNESDSLIHEIGRMGTQARVTQYLANNSFEAATITDAWVQGSNTTLSRQSASPYFGAYHGRIVVSGGAGETHQLVTFDDERKLSVGQTFTFYVWLSSSSAVSVSGGLILAEHDSGGSNDSTTADITLSGGEGYVRHSVTHTVTDSDSDELRVTISGDAGDTIEIDGAMLIHGDVSLNWFERSTYIQEANASSGSISADYADTQTYDTIGFDVDTVTTEHPWKRIEEGDTAWEHLKQLAEACAPLYVGVDENGTLRFRGVLADDYSDYVPKHAFDENSVEPGIGTSISMRQANRIIGHGAYIIKNQYPIALWFAHGSRSFDPDQTGYISESVANGDTWPPPDTYGPYFAQYSESGSRDKRRQPDRDREEGRFTSDWERLLIGLRSIGPIFTKTMIRNIQGWTR